MENIQLWKIPKDMVPSIKEAYKNGEMLYCISQFNEYGVGERLCPVCPDSISRIREYLKPLFLADIEVLYKERKRATPDELAELFNKYVSSSSDIALLSTIPQRNMIPVIAAFANAYLKGRGTPERKRRDILNVVLGISWRTYGRRFKTS